MSENAEHHQELELARWFLLSVQRHRLKAEWEDADGDYEEESGLSPDQQQHLAESFLQDRSALQSLRLVLRAPELQNRLIKIGQSRDLQQLQISDTSKAYLHAEHLLSQIEPPANEDDQSTQEISPTELPTIASRRAARRAAPVQSTSSDEVVTPRDESGEGAGAGNEMSDAEFSYLQKALAENEVEVVRRRRRLRINPDHLSLFYGVLAGLLLFVLVNWLIL